MHWTVSLEGGPQRVNHAAVAVGDKIYSFGGFCTGENYRNLRNMDVHVLDTDTFRWKLVPCSQGLTEVPFQRYGHTAVVYGNLVYIWGGRNDSRACNVLYCFDTSTYLWSLPEVHGSIPEERDGHSACVIKDSMYIFAGYLEYMESYTQDVHVLNMKSMKWAYFKTTGRAPVYRDFHTATSFDGMMYVWGGREVPRGRYDTVAKEEYGNSMYKLDTTTRHWSIVDVEGPVPSGRRSHSAFTYYRKIYFFGGYNSKDNVHFDDLYSFDPVLRQWRIIKPHGQGPCARRRQSCCMVGARMFLFGGTSPRPNIELELTEEEYFAEDLTDRRLMDHSDLHVLDFEPSLKTLCLLKVAKWKLDTSWLPVDLQATLKVMTLNNNISKPLNHTG
ncbi:kelch domain-containing protein 3 [Oratosquilla oratoria]|uniref:kelch domain-containing protein 3 n=1 Tax=Oratosquilla oratoria TaxID=337810 RepID=UPI003F758DA8